MKSSSIGYLIHEGVRNIRANRIMSAASVGVMAACLLLIGIAFLTSLNINSIIGTVEDQNEVVVFLADLPEAEIRVIELAIRETGNVFDVRFISRDEALRQELTRLGEASSLFEGLQGDENPLPDSFRLRVEELNAIQHTVEQLSKIDGVEKVNAPFDVVQTLAEIKNAVYTAGTALVALLICVSVMIISNTVRVAVFNRRREINIMKFVGATDWFIRFPFVVEGMCLGLLAALFSFFLLWGGYSWLAGWLVNNPAAWVQVMANGLVPFGSAAALLFSAFTLIGIFIGAAGSFFFVSKYLKV